MAKKPTTKKAATKKVAAKKAPAKKAAAKAPAKKAATKKTKAPDKGVKNKPATGGKIEDFRKSAISLNWKKDHLIREAKAIFGADNVKVDAHNNNQIAFEISGKRVPSDGYFSVN